MPQYRQVGESLDVASGLNAAKNKIGHDLDWILVVPKCHREGFRVFDDPAFDIVFGFDVDDHVSYFERVIMSEGPFEIELLESVERIGAVPRLDPKTQSFACRKRIYSDASAIAFLTRAFWLVPTSRGSTTSANEPAKETKNHETENTFSLLNPLIHVTHHYHPAFLVESPVYRPKLLNYLPAKATRCSKASSRFEDSPPDRLSFSTRNSHNVHALLNYQILCLTDENAESFHNTSISKMVFQRDQSHAVFGCHRQLPNKSHHPPY